MLIGFGAMSFVAAHWNEMPRLFRLAMIFGGLFGAYGIAGVLFERKHPTFAHAAVLAGVAIFGAGIMLIAQMFHIEGHPPDAVLTWALGALAAGVVLQSNPALALAMLLVCLWSGWETSDDAANVHWAFLLGWGAVTAAIAWQRWVAGSASRRGGDVGIWIISLGYLLFDGHGHGVVVGIGLLVAAAGVAAPLADERLDAWSIAGHCLRHDHRFRRPLCAAIHRDECRSITSSCSPCWRWRSSSAASALACKMGSPACYGSAMPASPSRCWGSTSRPSARCWDRRCSSCRPVCWSSCCRSSRTVCTRACKPTMEATP